MKIKSGFILAMLLVSVTTSYGWDGNRKGFLLGVGFGMGYDSYSGIQYNSISPEKHDNSTLAFAASPRIGYAFNNQMTIMYARHPLTFSVESDNGEDVNITTCTESLQFSYFFEDSAPSLYLGVGAGIGYFFDEETFDEPGMNYSSESLKGVGLYGIVGFEPIKHVTTELAIHYRSPQDGASDVAVSLLIGVLGY